MIKSRWYDIGGTYTNLEGIHPERLKVMNEINDAIELLTEQMPKPEKWMGKDESCEAVFTRQILQTLISYIAKISTKK